MSRYLKFSVIALLALICIVPAASARPRVFVGGYFGPGFYGPAYYGPAWYGPGWGWGAPYGYGYGYGYERGPATGGVKFDTKKDKDANVYVDNAYAGTVGELKTFQLKPGEHAVELRDRDGHSFFEERVNVIAGKTIKLNP
jgi:hypothetical protein